MEEVIYLGAVSLFHLDVPGLGRLVSQRMSHEEESASSRPATIGVGLLGARPHPKDMWSSRLTRTPE